jgi:phosphate transport system permease protein
VWRHSGLGYITGTSWFYTTQTFGSLPMLFGSAVVSGLALVLAAPLGLDTAIFLAEFGSPRGRLALKIAVELLAGIPSVVYGLLGVLFLRNWVYDALTGLGLDPLSGDSLITTGVLLAVMILPTLTTLADDALRAVPAEQRQAARALGLTRTETVFSVCLPQARSGLMAAVLLALGRGLGETIAVFLVVGRQDNQIPRRWLSLEPLIQAGQTLTSKIGGAETNIASEARCTGRPSGASGSSCSASWSG